MPRQARMKSTTGIYHIMIRGINKEKIFSNTAHKNKDEFIKFHNKNDDNLYIDTKEEETEHIQIIVNHVP